MSDLLSIGASGVRAYQTALNTVGENIANTGVAGYTRRTTELREVSATSGSINARYVTSGNGVAVAGIGRVADMFKAASVRQSSSDLGRTAAAATWLDRIETGLTDNGLSDKLTAFFTAARTLSGDPTSIPSRAVLIETATSTALGFQQTGIALDRTMTELDASGQQGVQTLNALATQLAKINDGLGRSSPGTASAAQLMDQRDQVLEQMSGLTDLSVRMDDLGRSTVTIGGSGGPTLVAGNTEGRVAYLRGATGAVSFVVQRTGTTAAFSPLGGALAGVVDGAQRIAETRTSLNAVAADFATQVNAVQAQGRTLDGVAGAPLFATGATPTDLRVVMTDPRGIAAAGAGGGTRDASNLAALQTVRTTRDFEGRTTTLITANAAALAQKQQVADAQGSIRDGAIAARDAVSAVDLDNEAVELLRFQQAYQASARVIQVARETMQSILDIR
ncbi:MAG TPA: flagellar hook-associated protein FlgK [Sphingomonas sp.]|nr:flagellar hook-associated protein FlgK [Sphingomonas sp.]